MQPKYAPAVVRPALASFFQNSSSNATPSDRCVKDGYCVPQPNRKSVRKRLGSSKPLDTWVALAAQLADGVRGLGL
jgi:hypothetical protein